MRALAALRMVWASAVWMDGGGDVGDVVCEEAAGGRAALAVSRVVGGAGEARVKLPLLTGSPRCLFTGSPGVLEP